MIGSVQVIKWVPAIASFTLLAGVATETGMRPRPELAVKYHEQVRKLSAEMPLRIGDWIGEDRPTTASAVKILKPNFIISRFYRNTQTNQAVGLLLVHCKDARDIAGHYPPNCYPSQGMNERARRAVDWQIDGVPICGTEYEFASDTLSRSDRVAVENFIITPGSYVRDMTAVRDQAGDFTKRFYGAAQVQLIFYDPVRWTDTQRRATFDTILKPYLPLVEMIRNGASS